jgi:para-aminobenzoate synthetase component 1
LADARFFPSLARRLAATGRADLFLSGAGRPGETRCMVGFAPRTELAPDPALAGSDMADFCFASPWPVLGFLSYSYGMALRGVASAKVSDFPPGCLRTYGAYLEFDRADGSLSIDGPDPVAVAALRRMADAPTAPGTPPAPPPAGPVRASLSRAGYEAGVRRTLEHIRDGHTYQLNLSIRFERDAPGLDALNLGLDLWRSNPAPFYALMRCGPFEIVSTSPERFLRVARGEVLSQPIKGTLRVDRDDPAQERLLTGSPKEDAELSMIVDLVRNDISAACEYGSVRVQAHKSVFRVDNLLQMYSDVRGRLRADRTVVDLLLDAFPGGSVTGCPKLRSMGIIEALEPHARDVYCGSFVLIRGPRDMDSNIAIRTLWRDTRSQTLTFLAGSGITIGSDPGAEYRETVAKAGKFLQTEDA